MTRTALVLALAVIIGAGLALPAAAAAPPTEQLRGHVDRVIQVLQDPALKRDGQAAARRAAVRKIAEDIFDFEETARRALGQHWQARTPAERQEFVKLFADLLEAAYLSKIDRYQGEKVTWLGDTVEGDQAAVKTRLVTDQGSEIPVEYRMHRQGDRWLVYDVLIEGVSLVANYRTQFNRIITTSSYQDLVTRLKARESAAPAGGRRS